MNLRFLLFALCWPLVVWAAPPEVGAPLPELQLQDQHGRDWRVTPETRLLLFASGRKASNLVQEVLATQPKGFLASRHAVYLADMSRMPGFVTRTFALPALREMPYAVGVVRDERLLADWPRQEDAVTVMVLEAGRIVSMRQIDNAGALRGALGLAD